MKRTFNSRTNALKALKEFSSEAVHHAKELITEHDGKFIFDEDAAEKYLQSQDDTFYNSMNLNLEITMNVKTATTSELVAFYNQHADKPIKKFRDRATAEARCQELLDLKASNEAAPVEAPAKPAKKDDGFLANTVAFAKHREEEKVSGKKEKSILKSILNPKKVPTEPKVVPAPVVKKEEPKMPEFVMPELCPHCGINLDNGIGYHLQEVNGKAIKNEKYEYVCLACDTEFGPEIKGHKSSTERTVSATQAETMKTSLKLDRTIVATVEGQEASWKNAYQLWKAHPDWMTSAQQDGLTAKLYKAAKEGQRITVEINGRFFHLANVV